MKPCLSTALALSEGLRDYREASRFARPLRVRIAEFFNSGLPATAERAATVFRVPEGALLWNPCPSDIEDAVLKQAARKRAKRLARRIGVVYWPALIGSKGVDPRCYLHAENVLTRLHGEWNPPECHGGWDSEGHHGLAGFQVRRMWLAAGCQDSPKFRLQVASRIVAKKSDTLPWLRHYIRGRRWLDAWRLEGYSRKAVAALGRLSPELRHAAVRGLPSYCSGSRRIRDLNWPEVARVSKLRADDSATSKAFRALALVSPRAAWRQVYGRLAYASEAHPVQDEAVPDLLPAFPLVSLETASRIIAGESPVSISEHALTRKEAHAWLVAGGRMSPVQWIVRDCPNLIFVPRSIEVARWLAHVHARGAWSALTAVVRHPDGRQMRRLDVIDEITAQDLDRGISTGVERAFERAGERLSKIDSGDHSTICRYPARWPSLPRCASLLTSPAALAAEGRVMGHCVGGYAHQVRAGQCYIISVVSRHGRSTVEVRPDGYISQHKGVKNDYPPARHTRLINAWAGRLAIAMNDFMPRKAA